MKKLFMTLLIIGAVVGVIAMISKRRSDGFDWRSFADEAEGAAKDAAEGATS